MLIVLQNIASFLDTEQWQAQCTYVAVVHFRFELNLRRLERVVVGEVNLQKEDAALVGAAGRTLVARRRRDARRHV